jgi:DMSO/TMAO reductase YedYZ molybdopterin-dependent catalytic subunit
LVLSPIHFAPSIAAAILTILLAFTKHDRSHKLLAYGMVFFAAIGFAGFILGDWTQLLGLSFHSIHAWVGLLVLSTSVATFLLNRRYPWLHCQLGRVAGILALISLAMGLVILFGLTPGIQTSASTVPLQYPASSKLPEVEAKEFMNTTLEPISSQGNNAIIGTQIIDRGSYRLVVSGLVNKTLTLTYDDLLNLPAYSENAYMPCVEGWGFWAKWTGFRVTDLLDEAGVSKDGVYVVFYCADGYSTGLPIKYLRDNHILLAYGLNDVTLPPDRGFPLQLVAESKYGYKWAKWIVKIDVVNQEVQGYWESRGYTDSADVGTFPFVP